VTVEGRLHSFLIARRLERYALWQFVRMNSRLLSACARSWKPRLPVITKYWVEDAFPFELLPAVVEFSETELRKSSWGKILKRIRRERFWVNQERSVG
jgi:hypothetical protein